MDGTIDCRAAGVCALCGACLRCYTHKDCQDPDAHEPVEDCGHPVTTTELQGNGCPHCWTGMTWDMDLGPIITSDPPTTR